MPSSWIITRPTKDGSKRYRCLFRVGGRESRAQYGGSFATKAEALARKRWIDGQLAAMLIPDLAMLATEPERAPTVAKACEAWRASRVDVTDGTQALHRIALARVLPVLGTKHVDEVTVEDVAKLIETLAAAKKKRETIRKSVKYLAAVLDENGRSVDNPARSKRLRLPYEEVEEVVPPDAETVETVARLLPPSYRLALAWLDWSGARVASVDLTTVGDYDEAHRRVRLRAATTKTRKALWVDLPDVLADAIEANLLPRDDRDPAAALFPDVTGDRLRTAIGRAARAAGVVTFSPHSLRHRRVSLLHRQGKSWAEIGQLVGQRKLSVTSDIYAHVIVDPREVDYQEVLQWKN